MPPRLCDPHAGPEGARHYIQWWGDTLYRDWCTETGVAPINYSAFCTRTLQCGKDWWANTDDTDKSLRARLGKRTRDGNHKHARKPHDSERSPR